MNLEYLYIALVVFLILLWGFLTIALKSRAIGFKRDFAIEYLEKLRSLYNNHNDSNIYSWLIHRSNKMQSNMGVSGYIYSYSPPYQNIKYQRYPIILNMIPDLKNELDHNNPQLYGQYMSMIQEALVRNIGVIEDKQNEVFSDLRNPLNYFKIGIQNIVSLPIQTLKWFGIVSPKTSNKMISSTFVSLISGITALLSLISIIMTIIVGWDKFYKTIASYLPL